MSYLDMLFFAVLPYLAVFTLIIISVLRYAKLGFTYSSLSSQFLENKQHFWGLVPFHYGILTVLAGHFIAFLIPREILWWNSKPARLYVLEVFALVAGVMALVGLINIVARRLTVSKVRMTTSVADWLVLGLLLFSVVTGLYTALFYRWGSSWFASSMSPYLWSILKLNPDLSYITPMPAIFKLHVIAAYLMVLLFPFTRLVHILVVPNPYLWRKPQLVRWYWDRRRIRRPAQTYR
ncbi:MAG TPA: respiratory nitrate reductase subunit gamma [Acidobacteriota bacterium]|nr:respiratory nitrate reductase subunit gamma [Acidobacteriota bacterium]